MKTLLAFLLLLALSTACWGQDGMPKYTGMFYKLSENAPGYASVYDTLATPTSSAPRIFHKGDKLLITGYPFPNWATGAKSGSTYLVRTKSLVLAEKPSPEVVAAQKEYQEALKTPARPAPANGMNSSPSPVYQSIQTGPRGGHYYINSKGNKTYIKRK